MTLQDKEGPIDAAIAQHLIEATSEWWTSATLVIEWQTIDGGFEKFAHTISNKDGHREFVVATDTIHSLTLLLAEVFREHGTPCKRATY
jgi:hypothetical protein